MEKQIASPDRIEGYPSFVRRVDDPFGLNWWSPDRTGNSEVDYSLGSAHLDAALLLLNALRDPSAVDFYRSLISPAVSNLYPASVLTNIVQAMQVTGPMELGFLSALCKKAIAGRAPPVAEPHDNRFSDDARWAENHAHACLELGRATGMPHLVTEELISIIDRTFIAGTGSMFIWTVCAAAAAGALN